MSAAYQEETVGDSTAMLARSGGLPQQPLRPQAHKDGANVELTGAWTLNALHAESRSLQRSLALLGGPRTRWNLHGIAALDEFGALLLWQAWKRRLPSSVLMRPEHQARFANLPAGASAPRARSSRPRPLDLVRGAGQSAISLVDHAAALARLLGELIVAAALLPVRPHLVPWREISANIYRGGAQALAITGLVGALIGVVLSYLFALQLRAYGADLLIIPVLGIGVLRELGPMLAAILVAGRSGASIAAQIGVMRVTQELDAMNVMGISRTLRLVLPKVLALTIALPLLVLWTDAAALLGGMLAAHYELGVSYAAFIANLPASVPAAHLWLGVGKAAVFGMVIALVSCHFGLRIQPNSESLGVGTTQAVVAAITVVIVLDAIFAVVFSDVGYR
jgi:phospholipid/cholesterol/gamma-HCH transport system permease protein